MADAIPAGPTGNWGDLDEAAWQEMRRQKPRRLPPNDGVLEQRLLGMLLTHEEEMSAGELPEGLLASHFVDPVHRSIYKAIQQCHEKGLPVNPIHVAVELKDKPDLTEVGGTAYLSQLVSAAEATDPASRIKQAASTVAELAHARALLGQLGAIEGLIQAHEELVRDPVALGSGRARAHLLAMDLIGIARDVLDRSAGWA